MSVDGSVRRRVPVDGAELDVLVGGSSERGARTVCTAHAYAPMDAALPALAAISEARVVCVSPRGVGSSTPAVKAHDSTLECMADDLDAVRRALGVDRWTIWGMSGGSMIAQVYAHRHPETLEALILDSAGPCFAATVADPDCLLNPSHPRWRAALAAAGLAGAAAGPGAGAVTAADLSWEEVPGAAWALRRPGGPVLLMSPEAPTPGMRRTLPVLLGFDARPWLGDVRVPTLVLAGTEDPIAPLGQLRALHEALPGSTLIAIEGAGHVPLVERHADVAAAVRRFLADRAWPERAWPERVRP